MKTLLIAAALTLTACGQDFDISPNIPDYTIEVYLVHEVQIDGVVSYLDDTTYDCTDGFMYNGADNVLDSTGAAVACTGVIKPYARAELADGVYYR